MGNPTFQQVLVKTAAFISVLLLFACAPSTQLPSPTSIPPTPESNNTASAPLDAQLPTEISTSASWIEIDLTNQIMLLHEGSQIAAEYPVSTGVTSDPKYATPPGLYKVQSKEKGPIENVPGVFVSDIIMFDIYNGNGIHSMPMNADGKILDTTLGKPTTAGCVRVGESASVFKFAELGMWVWIH